MWNSSKGCVEMNAEQENEYTHIPIIVSDYVSLGTSFPPPQRGLGELVAEMFSVLELDGYSSGAYFLKTWLMILISHLYPKAAIQQLPRLWILLTNTVRPILPSG